MRLILILIQILTTIISFFFFYQNQLTLKQNNILIQEMTNKMSLLIDEKKLLETIEPEVLIEKVNSSSSEETLIYTICSISLVFLIGVIIYSFSKGNTPPPGGGGSGEDSFKSLVVQNLVKLSEDNQIISEKIDDLIEITQPVEVVKNVLMEWKFQ